MKTALIVDRVVSRRRVKHGNHTRLRMVVLARWGHDASPYYLEAVRKPSKGPWFFRGHITLAPALHAEIDGLLDVAWGSGECST